MEDKTITKATIIGAIIVILSSIGIPIYDTVFDNELKDYYFCTISEQIQEFKGGVSGTAYTAYPFTDSRKGYVRCGTTDNKGEWIGLKEYAQSLGIDPYDLVIEKDSPNSNELTKGIWGKKYHCNPECVEV